MKSLVRLIVFVLLSGLAVLPAKAAFSSLYAFGDGVSTTTASPAGGALYYEDTYCNGRVWIEVLAQRQGVTYDASKNNSYYGHYSSIVETDTHNFSAPDASNALFVVWVNNADFVYDILYLYPPLNQTTWNNAINSSLANHGQIITNLYLKGARTLIMPKSVDITKVPYYAYLVNDYPTDVSSIRQMVTDFNTRFAAMSNQAMASLPGLRIYVPDFFTLLNNMLANPGSYGLVNPGVDALEDPNLTDYSLNGPGALYVFWDYQDPTAKAHEVVADTVQALISLANINKLTSMSGSNRLDIINMPIGLSGFVDGRTNLALGNWTQMTNFNSASATQTIYVPASGPQRSYRLRFPLAWSWP